MRAYPPGSSRQRPEQPCLAAFPAAQGTQKTRTTKENPSAGQAIRPTPQLESKPPACTSLQNPSSFLPYLSTPLMEAPLLLKDAQHMCISASTQVSERLRKEPARNSSLRGRDCTATKQLTSNQSKYTAGATDKPSNGLEMLCRLLRSCGQLIVAVHSQHTHGNSINAIPIDINSELEDGNLKSFVSNTHTSRHHLNESTQCSAAPAFVHHTFPSWCTPFPTQRETPCGCKCLPQLHMPAATHPSAHVKYDTCCAATSPRLVVMHLMQQTAGVVSACTAA